MTRPSSREDVRPQLPEGRLPVAGPWITDLEVEYVTQAARTSWYEGAGRFTQRFEQGFSELVGRAHAIALPSCTAGLHLALAALGVGPGDEVVVPDSTWIATVAPVRYVGAEPVFADVDPDTWCITAQELERCITPRTRAVVAVDLYGSMPDYDALLAVAAKHGVPVIEDAAEAVGSSRRGVAAGGFGRVSTFSFHGSKTLTTGEGGMVLTDDPGLHARMLFLRDHGRTPGDTTFFNTEIGYKYKMTDLQAACGVAQLERVQELVERKRQIYGWYRSRLADDPRLSLNAEPPGVLNSFWMSTVVLREDQPAAAAIGKALATEGIDTRPFFHALSSLPALAEAQDAHRAEKNVVSRSLAARGLNLPSALCLTETDVDRVAEALLSLLDAA